MTTTDAIVLGVCLNTAIGVWLWVGLNVHPPGTKLLWLRCLGTVLFWLPLVVASFVANWWTGYNEDEDD